jgi:hypothetical protein
LKIAISTGGDAPGLNAVIRGAVLASLHTPEIPFDLAKVCEKIRRREVEGEGKFGNMVALRSPTIDSVAIEEALATPKRVPLDSDTIATARDLGISLGD